MSNRTVTIPAEKATRISRINRWLNDQLEEGEPDVSVRERLSQVLDTWIKQQTIRMLNAQGEATIRAELIDLQSEPPITST